MTATKTDRRFRPDDAEAAPAKLLSWRTPRERNGKLKAWRRAVMAMLTDQQTRALRIAWTLESLFNAETGYAYPSNAYLAIETGIASNKVQQALGELEQGGAIVRRITRSKSGTKRQIYPVQMWVGGPPATGVGGTPSGWGCRIREETQSRRTANSTTPASPAPSATAATTWPRPPHRHPNTATRCSRQNQGLARSSDEAQNRRLHPGQAQPEWATKEGAAMTAEIVPFPATRRTSFITKMARLLANYSAAGADRALDAQLAQTRIAMERKGIAPELAEREVGSLELAIRNRLRTARIAKALVSGQRCRTPTTDTASPDIGPAL